jgi:hypothetical protein
MGNAFTHVPPYHFHGVKVRGVSRQTVELKFKMRLKKRLKAFDMMKSHVINIEDNRFLSPICEEHFPQMLFKGCRIPAPRKTGYRLSCERVDAPKTGNTLPVSLLAWCHRLLIYRRPRNGKCSGIA